MQFKQLVDEVVPEPPPVPPVQEPPTVAFTMPRFQNYHDQQAQVQGGQISGNFVTYLMGVENSVRKGFKNGKWYPHQSVEGGSPTIAYGHKIKPGENFNAGLTEQQAMALLVKDIREAEAAATKIIDREFGAGTWTKLSTYQKEMLTDFAFNGVLLKFPEFRKGVIQNNPTIMKAQYKRFSKGRELTGRNNAFYSRYLTRI